MFDHIENILEKPKDGRPENTSTVSTTESPQRDYIRKETPWQHEADVSCTVSNFLLGSRSSLEAWAPPVPLTPLSEEAGLSVVSRHRKMPLEAT